MIIFDFQVFFYNFELLLQSLLSFICCINNRGDCLIDFKLGISGYSLYDDGTM